MDPTPSSIPSTEKLGDSKRATESVLHGAPGTVQAPSSTTAEAAAAAPVSDGGISPPVYRCMFCTSTFMSPQALGGHQNAHRYERAGTIPRSRWWPMAYCWDGGPSNRALSDGAAQYRQDRRSRVEAWQAGTSVGATQESSVAAPAGYQWTGDGGHPRHQNNARGLNEEEEQTPNGIDLTLRL